MILRVKIFNFAGYTGCVSGCVKMGDWARAGFSIQKGAPKDIRTRTDGRDWPHARYNDPSLFHLFLLNLQSGHRFAAKKPSLPKPG